MKLVSLRSSMLLLALLLLSCLGEASAGQTIEGVVSIDMNAREYGIGEFLSTERTIHKILVDNVTGAQYEVIDAITTEAGKAKHIGFYRTNVLDRENIKEAINRVQGVCAAAVKQADFDAYTQKNEWYDAKAKKVSCLIFKKDN